MTAGSRVTSPELDDALARAIRQLIAEAIEAGADTENETGKNGSAAA